VASAARRVGTDGLKFSLTTARGAIDALGWGMAARSGAIAAGREIDIAYRLDVNEYRGQRTLQAVLQDFRPCAGA
jgi:single-stranded-DNA-specific exonuclease